MKKFSLLALALALVLPVSAFAAKKKEAPKAVTFTVNPSTSKVTWEGKKITGATHHGEMNIKDGKLMATADKLTGGEFEMDMKSIKDIDQTDPAMNKKLVGHLSSDDFFAIEKFPTSKFVITKVVGSGSASSITGDLTIKGITNPITFPADIQVTPEAISAKGKLTVDRTKYNIRFNSVKFFSNLGDKVINDEFVVDVDLHAAK